MRPPRPRPEIFATYWRFAYERQQIFERRLAGESGPWTDDPILQTYKFCNVFRAADRESQALIRETACNPAFDGTEDQLFQIIAYRFFSKHLTWKEICEVLGHPPMIRDLANGKFLQAVEETKAKNGTIYTNAFILCANKAFGHDEKHKNHADLFKRMFVADKLGTKIQKLASFREIYECLRTYPLMGNFMSYQLAVDLNYSSQVNFDENDFCQPGPGALRGIKKAFEDTGSLTPAKVVHWMVKRQQEEFDRRGLAFGGLFGRPLHAIDAQGLFCELDKYCRVAFPSLKSERTRIKTKFAPQGTRQELFFPPKWGLKVPALNS